MILLAFMILLLSATVVWILAGKFEEEIARLRGAHVAAHVANLNRWSVLGAAVRLGLSNMRRRGLRTALTLCTIILLTFTLLCFTSVRESVLVTSRPVANASGQSSGILMHSFSWRDLPDQTQLLGESLAGERGIVAQRFWYASQRSDQPWLLSITPVDGRGTGPYCRQRWLSRSGHANEAEFEPRLATTAWKAGICWPPAAVCLLSSRARRAGAGHPRRRYRRYHRPAPHRRGPL